MPKSLELIPPDDYYEIYPANSHSACRGTRLAGSPLAKVVVACRATVLESTFFFNVSAGMYDTPWTHHSMVYHSPLSKHFVKYLCEYLAKIDWWNDWIEGWVKLLNLEY